MALSKTTRDHDTIRKWAEARGAQPAEVRGTHKGNQTGILRFCFPNARNRNDENLQEVSWDEFFEKFDQNGLELIFQEKTAGGAKSNFNKLIYPEDEHASGRSRSSGTRTSANSSRNAGSRSGSSGKSASVRSISSGRGSSRKTGSSGRSSSSSSRSSSSGRSTSSGRTSSSGRSGSSSRKRAA
jgi:hypothetical protein